MLFWCFFSQLPSWWNTRIEADLCCRHQEECLKSYMVGSEKQNIDKELTRAGGQAHRNCSWFLLLNASGVWKIPAQLEWHRCRWSSKIHQVFRPFSMAKHQLSIGPGFPVDRRIGVEKFANIAGNQVPVDPFRREAFQLASLDAPWQRCICLLFLVRCRCTTPY